MDRIDSSSGAAPDFLFENWLTRVQEPLPQAVTFGATTPLTQALVLRRIAAAAGGSATLAVFATKSEARSVFDNLSFLYGASDSSHLHYIPPLDFDYYRSVLPSSETIAERNVALFHALNDPAGRVFVTTAAGVANKVMPVSAFIEGCVDLAVNAEIDRDHLIERLTAAGYRRQPAALDRGVFAVRGLVVDVFCPTEEAAYRIEFFGDLIESIRTFDPVSQRSQDSRQHVAIVPVSLSVGKSRASSATDVVIASALKHRLDAEGIPKLDRDALIEKFRLGSTLAEYPFLFPILSQGTASIFDFFGESTIYVWAGRDKIAQGYEQTEYPRLIQNHSLYEKQPAPIAPAEQLFLDPSILTARTKDGCAFEDFGGADTDNFWRLPSLPLELPTHSTSSKVPGGVLTVDQFAQRYRALLDEGYAVHLVCHTRLHAERTKLLFEPRGITTAIHAEVDNAFAQIFVAKSPPLHVWIGTVTESSIFPSLKLALINEEGIFHTKKRASRASTSWQRSSDPSRLISTFRDLKSGDYIVHRDHGIGRYLGLRSMNFLGIPNDYILIEYRDRDKLYVPVYRLNVLQKYIGAEGAKVSLDKLGGQRWTKAKAKAQSAATELAAEFLKIQARRKLIPAHAFEPPGEEFHQFELGFAFDETPDQAKAIDDVMRDLSQPHPMDRLICGDVGYGKTEIAMRAAYRAVLGGKQVAVLVPTTVLCFQHFESFKKRFANTGVRLEMLSRLRSGAEIKATIADLASGKIDIVIGTHRLLSSDVVFKSLALIIVDEEHRFGVAHKDRLKKIARSVHVMSLTATPIPRTLNMAMTGIKELSVITTPPPDRLAVRTFICRDAHEVIVDAISQEAARRGQVFFVHNRIETIFERGAELQELLPKLKIEVVHGQMEPKELETKMLRFYRGESDLLLTTTIIESGLDIPSANTIIVDRADHFGLAQLYQLRGRVGRSEKRAYCYLLIPEENALTQEAKERLQVIQRYTELGSGFHIASHDLEIRGAGDLLGKDQSGHLSAIGIDLYFELLEQSIRALRGEPEKVEVEPEINLSVPSSFPPDYLPDVVERIQLYRRLSDAQTEEEISGLEAEIRDRFGPLPEEVVNLLGLMQIRLHLKRMHVLKMSCGPKKTSLQFAPTTPAKPDKLIELVQSDQTCYAITPDQKLVFSAEQTDWRSQLQQVERLADILTT